MKKIQELFNLKGRVAIVTGGSRGLGKAIATGLAEQGAKIVIADLLEEESKKTADEIAKISEAIAVKTDVSKKADVDALVQETIKKFGKIDILVNNAGIFRATPVETITEEEWEKTMHINLNGYLLCSLAASKEMIKQKKGSIINIASVAGMKAFATSAAYNASKAAIISLTQSLATELAKYNIRVNAICPGVFATDMTKGFLASNEFLQMIKAQVPLGRAAQPDELKGIAVLLASDASSYITGTTIVVDGGWTCHL